MQKRWIVPILVLFVALIYKISFRSKEQCPVVTISSGKIRGFIDTSRGGREFYSYLGIPYAKVNRRFEPAEPVTKWTDVKLTQNYGAMCPQVDNFAWKVVGEEDCLFINIFRPKNIDADTQLPVMVYIHGGYFMTGSGNHHHPHYLMDENLIFITLNYRIGALGFLSTQDEHAQGNMGLKDQVAALEWIRENVEQFQGNPNRVTLFGESAGAAAVHFHILSPMSKGLFHRAISNSGTAIKIWSLSTKPKEQATRLGQRLNCPTENSEVLVNCLRNLSATEILQTQMESITPLLDPLIMYGPTVEGSDKHYKSVFLPEHPYTLLIKGKFNAVPWITGLNQEEGLLITGRIAYEDDLVTQLEQNWQSVLPLYLQSPPDDHILTRQIVNFYLKKSLQPNEKLNFTENFKPLTDMMTDRNYLVATRQAAIHHAAKAKVFLYYYKWQGEHSFTTFFGFRPNIPVALQFAWKFTYRKVSRVLGLDTNHVGVCHGDDLFLFFRVPFMEVNVGSPDYEFSRSLVKTWVSFIYNENDMTFNGIPWTPISANSTHNKLQYLTFEPSGNHGMKNEEFTERVEFWQKLSLPWIL